MHFHHFSTGFFMLFLLLAGCFTAAYLLRENTWRRIFNKPKRLVVPITKDDADKR